MFPKPTDRKFGCRGGVVNDGAGLQAWLDAVAGKSGHIDRAHLTDRPLQVHPGTTIYGPGGIGAHPSFSPADFLVSVPSGCRFFGVGFNGNEATREGPWGATMLNIAGADDVVLDDCRLSWWRTLVSMAQTNRVQYTGCDFAHWADSRWLPDRASPEGQAIIAANAALPEGERKHEWELPLRGYCNDDGGGAILGSNGDWPNDDVDVIGCRFHDGNWTAINCLQPRGIRWRILNTTIERVHECGIYCGATAIIDNVTISYVWLRDCSAHGIEGGGEGTIIKSCRIGKTDAASAFIINPRGMRITGSTFYDPMQIAPLDSDPTVWSASIFVRNVPSAPEHLANGLTIADNEFISDGRATHCCSFFDMGGGPFHNCRIGPNYPGGNWKGGEVHCDPAAQGHNFHIIGGHHA